MISRFLRRPFVFILVMTLALCSVVQIAYAEESGGGSFDDDQIIYGPTIYNVRNSEYATLVYSGTSYNAALVALGYNPYDAKFTADVKAYLSNNSTGGSFYEFANLFTNQRPEPSLTLGNSSFVSAWLGALTLYPENNLFGAIYTESLANSAKQRVEDVLSGDVSGGSGGSGGSGSEEGSVTYTLTNGYGHYHTSTSGDEWLDASLVQPTVTMSSDAMESLRYHTDTFGTDKMLIYMIKDSGVRDSVEVTVLLSTEDFVVTANNPPEGTRVSYSITCPARYLYFTDNLSDNTFPDVTVGNFSSAGWKSANSNMSSSSYVALWTGNVEDLQPNAPTVPPSNWPDNPTVVTPTPPELPEPRDPVIPNPPADPVPTEPPTYITQPTYNVSVFTADLQGILDAMDEHCIHLQNALYTDLQALYNKLASTITEDNQKTRTLISNRFTWLGNVISECLDTLNDNLYDYFHWLAEQFDFQSADGYNDSTLISWLKKIYYKLGSGSPVNPKPVDPVSDPFDFGKWLSDLWNTFIADLIAIGAEGMAAIADDLQQLIHKFPFSIPWDIAAMLALLVAEPQTPVIQWPMFTYNGSSVQVVQTTIDLTPYNNYVEPVRVMIKIGFAAVLAWRTKDMMELLTMARGGNNA